MGQRPLPAVEDNVNPSLQDVDNPVGNLQELCHREKFFCHTYREDELKQQPDKDGNFTYVCCVVGEHDEVLFEARGTGSKKKHAKKEAARAVICWLAGQDDEFLFEATAKGSKKKHAKKRLPGESLAK